MDVDETNAQQFLQDNPASFAVIYDPKGTITKHFSIQSMPTSMLINHDGVVKYRHSGFFTGKINQYEDEIKRLLISLSPILSKDISNKTHNMNSRGKHES